MPRRARQAGGSGIHHVMMRGVNRDPIFLEDEDRDRFLAALAAARDASGCRVLAYCLMDNHVHLVLRTGAESLGAAVKRVGVRYVYWFNRKYGRVGHLFQDRFKSVPVEDDAHLVVLLRYVWNNPVKAGLVERADEYPWSSRRVVGPSAAVDADELMKLLPADPLALLTDAEVPSWEAPRERGPRPRYSEEEAAALVRRACGAAGPASFQHLDRDAQREAVRELRLRCVPFSQLARLTGLSTASLKRMHATRGGTRRPTTDDESRTE